MSVWIALKLCLTYLAIWCYINPYSLPHLNILLVQSVLVRNDLERPSVKFPQLVFISSPTEVPNRTISKVCYHENLIEFNVHKTGLYIKQTSRF